MMTQVDLTRTRPTPAFTPLATALLALLTLLLVMSLAQLVERRSGHATHPPVPTTVGVTAPPQP